MRNVETSKASPRLLEEVKEPADLKKNQILLSHSWPKSLGGVVGASLAIFAFKDTVDTFLRPYVNTCFSSLPLSGSYASVVSPYVAPSLLFVAGWGCGFGIQSIAQRCLKKDSKDSKDIKLSDAASESRILKKKKEEFDDLALELKAIFSSDEVMNKLALFLEQRSLGEMRYICDLEGFWKQIEQALNGEKKLQKDVSLDTLKVVTKLAVWDPSDDLISLIHRIIESFENEQCPIKEALLLITSCGHPKLDFQAIKSLCRKIDVTGNLLRKLQKKHQEAEDLLFKDITSYFTRIPNQINVSLANELLKTLPRFLKRLVPAQIEFLCRMPHFWAIIADKHIRSATTEFSVESLRTMAEFLSYHPQQDIRPLNFILETLDVSDPLLKEKLMALASSGHPELNENLLVAKAKELDKPSSGKDKIKECIQKTYKAAEKDKKQKKWVLLSSSSSAIKC